MKVVILVVVVDNLDFGIRDVAFEAKVFSRYGTFHQIANRSMEDPSYAHLHYDLLNKATLTTITLNVKSPHTEMHEQHLQKGMFVRVKILALNQNLKGFLKNVTCMLSL
jgi:hypothetical protein